MTRDSRDYSREFKSLNDQIRKVEMKMRNDSQEGKDALSQVRNFRSMLSLFEEKLESLDKDMNAIDEIHHGLNRHVNIACIAENPISPQDFAIKILKNIETCSLDGFRNLLTGF